MNTPTVVVLLHCLLIPPLVRSAPISTRSDLPPAFREASDRAKTLVEKILKAIPSVHSAAITTESLTLDPIDQSTNLQMMMTSLGIPAAPVLKPLSERFTLDECVNRMLVGSRLYKALLGVLSDRLSGLDNLGADLRDLLIQITKLKEAAELGDGDVDLNYSADITSRLHGKYEVQVAAHLTLSQLRSFCHDLIRSLRAIATYRSHLEGTRQVPSTR